MATLYQIDEIKSRLNPVFAAVPVYRAVLFGSYARGTATDASDVDIVIDSKGKLLNLHFYGLLEDITEQLDKSVDLFEWAELRRNPAMCAAVEQEGVVLYEK
ncbi:Nucleotidyltransferase domain-containing protein [Paenibacillus sophorae]|uniref:Nucleotidyltransferase domain-containing protein n=1 Tax=Paenibacillus sophorae TaxID=1333845 RepID=A0A1H8UD17_9BACL|nr:nucleotidyltransferase domain-containing protein [Paenibacillus sophorae]QWU13187.1 nucleotidyltransferase domain-containing protein [Paenibacillus sophorae]SEP00927.1 Nucleotidyltransferase domain-containing protein [Paenibacillus sophorae]